MKPFTILLHLTILMAIPVQAADSTYEINQLLQKGKNQQALEKIDAFLSSQPKDAWGRNITQMRFLKGTLLAEEKRTAEAVQVFLKLSQDYPGLPEPYNNLAVLYAAQGRDEDARDALEHALRTDPAYAAAYRNLNEIYTRLSARAYEHTLQSSKGGKPVPALIKELCDNYGSMANHSIGRGQSGGGAIGLIREIPGNRTGAGAPPNKIDIDEMAVSGLSEGPSLPPAFTNPAAKVEPVPAGNASQKEQAPVMGEDQLAVPDEDKVIISTVQKWAVAWSAKNVGSYLAFYAKDFRVPHGQSRTEWERLRSERLNKPKVIRVTLSGLKVVKGDANHAIVSFRQGYRSDNLQTSGIKTLLMSKNGGKWLIQEERVGG